MNTVVFDFSEISTLTQFYKTFQKKFDLPSSIANNLDGLWDAVTGIIELPVKIEFHNLNLDQLDKFQKLISLLEEAETETDNELEFSYFMSR